MMNSNDYILCLIKKGVTCLYHANSVATSLTYLNNGGLLSREQVDKNGLKQTSQQTDFTDKTFGVYGDVFFDSVDIHSRAKTNNHYGPVSFVFDINVLRDYQVRITKDNPQNWVQGMPERDRFFTSEEEIACHFTKGNFKQEVIICTPDKAINFDYLNKIIIDDPHIDDTTYFETAWEALTAALVNNRIDVPLEIRKCSNDCHCFEKYRSSNVGYTYHRFKILL